MIDRRTMTIALATFLALALPGASIAGDNAPKAHTAKAAPVATVARNLTTPHAAALPTAHFRAGAFAPGTGGLVVGIDPETGVLGPATAAQRLALFGPEAALLSRSTVGLVETPLPGGGVMMNLGGGFQDLSVVRRAADGHLVFGCIDDFSMLRRLLTTPAKPLPTQPLEDR